MSASVEVAELMGAEIILYSQVNNQSFVARIDSRFNISAGDTIDLALDLSKAHFLR